MEGGKGNVEGRADRRRTERSWKERKEGHITAPGAVHSMRTPTHSIQVSTIKTLKNDGNSEMAETGGNKPKWQKQVEMTGARPEVAFYGAKTRRVTV